MVTVQQYLERGRDYYNNDESEINIWGENFKGKPFDNGDLVIEGFDKVSRIYVSGIYNVASSPTATGTAINKNLKIPHITVKNCSPHLNEINLYRNNTEKITFEGDFSNVLYLDVSGNNLTELDLTPFPNLLKLDIGYNLIENIDLSKCPKLVNFECSYDPLKDLDFSHNKELEYLILSNQIKGPNLIKKSLRLEPEKILELLGQVGKNLKLLSFLRHNGLPEIKKIINLLNPDELQELHISHPFLREDISILSDFKKIRSLTVSRFYGKLDFSPASLVDAISEKKQKLEKDLTKAKDDIERLKSELKICLNQEEKRQLKEQIESQNDYIAKLEGEPAELKDATSTDWERREKDLLVQIEELQNNSSLKLLKAQIEQDQVGWEKIWQYFQKKRIQKVSWKNNEGLVVYYENNTGKSISQSEIVASQEMQKIRDYLVNSTKKVLSQAELVVFFDTSQFKKSSNNSSQNLPWIGGGIILVMAFVGTLFILVWKKKFRSKGGRIRW